jgi:hypothetical protein
MRRLTLVLAIISLLTAACNRAAEPDLTTTTSTQPAVTGASSPTSTTATSGTTSPGGGSTTSTIARVPVESFDIQVQTTSDAGNVLWVTIPPADYTDKDIEDFILEQIDSQEGLAELHVFDDKSAVDAARIPEGQRTEEEQKLVDDHYLASLEGNKIIFRGPFEAAGEMVVGS